MQPKSPKQLKSGLCQTFEVDGGLSQEKMGEAAGLSRNYIGNLERQENKPSIETIEKLAKGLGVDPEVLLKPEE